MRGVNDIGERSVVLQLSGVREREIRLPLLRTFAALRVHYRGGWNAARNSSLLRAEVSRESRVAKSQQPLVVATIGSSCSGYLAASGCEVANALAALCALSGVDPTGKPFFCRI